MLRVHLSLSHLQPNIWPEIIIIGLHAIGLHAAASTKRHTALPARGDATSTARCHATVCESHISRADSTIDARVSNAGVGGGGTSGRRCACRPSLSSVICRGFRSSSISLYALASSSVGGSAYAGRLLGERREGGTLERTSSRGRNPSCEARFRW